MMRLSTLLREETHPRSTWAPELLAGAGAIAGVVAASLPGFNVTGWQDASSDFKTLYASGRCFLTGVRAYNFPNIEKVFDANHIVKPLSWYAHAPTYPPFTFGILSPVIALPMATAAYVWLALSAAALVAAIWAMSSVADRTFGLHRPWRLLLVALIAASPLTSFGLFIGNVSVVAASLCIVAVMGAGTLHPSLRAVALTVSLLLKPHIALCLMVGMMASRNREDRAVVLRTCVFFAAALLCFAACTSIMLPFGMQLHDYTAMVRSEIATGCLNPRNHELLSLAPQVTSLESLLGYLVGSPWMQILSTLALVLLGGTLVVLSRTAPGDRADLRLELLGAWSTFGLLATYHRTHDGVILFLLLPWLLTRLSRRGNDLTAWGTLALLVLMSVGPDYPALVQLSRQFSTSAIAQFLIFRQASLAMLLLLLLLLGSLMREVRMRSVARLEETVAVA